MSNQEKSFNRETDVFNVTVDGLYAITINAACDESQDLRVEIDGLSFREIPPEKNVQKFNIPAAFNGSKLKGKSQTNIFLINLAKGQYNLNFIGTNNAKISAWQLRKIETPALAIFDLNLPADNLDRQPFVNFILVNLPLFFITANVTTNWHKWDGDDVKLIIDGETAKHWRAFPWHKIIGPETIQYANSKKLEQGTHYLEFVADCTPMLEQVKLNVGNAAVAARRASDFDYRINTILVEGKPEAVIGIYIPSGTPSDINNDNIEVYFGNEKLRLGVNKEAKWAESVFDFSSQRASDGKWFYYGIDSTWRAQHLTDLSHWEDHDEWRIYKK